jgi:ring-1,2-phenylacetyl-CoA epoxidase subunit PaaD
VLDIVELGIVRGAVVEGDRVRVDVTPTYSGCPAMEVIEDEIVAALTRYGFAEVTVRRVFSPAWTTDWMSEEARTKLMAYGIAPPGGQASSLLPLGPPVRRVACPWCGSDDTRLESEFGATACKSLYVCRTCRQPFEHFKAI